MEYMKRRDTNNKASGKNKCFTRNIHKNRMSHKDNENNIENGFIFMEKGKSMFHVKHFLDKYSEK